MDNDADGDIATRTVTQSSHNRNASLPPQKYDVGDSSGLGPAVTTCSTSIGEEADISQGQDMSMSSSSYGMSREPSSAMALERADLQFVDIKLGEAGELDPNGPLTGSLKSAEQIRTDSFSNEAPPKSLEPEADRSFPHLSRSDSHQSNASDSLGVDDYTSRHDQHANGKATDHQDRRVSMGSISGDGKSVEGRYRGRVSRSSSRAASPIRDAGSRSLPCEPQEAQSAAGPVSKSAPAHTSEFLRPAPTLVAADEDGNISIPLEVPVSPRTVTAPEISPRPLPSASSVGTDAASTSDSAANASAEVKSPGLSDKADDGASRDRRKSSSAFSAEPLESRTRMTTLPAKSKTEEIKHRVDFERMMIFAKENEKKRAEEDSERKRKKQDEQREALARWEKDILPSWTRARKDDALAELWWKGAPPSIRGRVWALAIGNPLMLPRNLLEQTEKRATSNGGTAESSIPPDVLDAIDADVQETLPTLKLFQESGPFNEDLWRICRAFVLVRIEQLATLDSAGDADQAASRLHSTSPRPKQSTLPSPGDAVSSENVEGSTNEYAQRGIEIYQKGLAVLAAILLVNLPVSTAFICLLNLIHSKPWLKALYSLLPAVLPGASPSAQTDKHLPHRGTAYNLAPKEKTIRGFERVFETLLADTMPKVYANLLARNVQLHRVVLRDWVGQLFGKHLDVDTVMRLWDNMLLDETDSLIYRTCLALVQTLESRLYVPDHDELVSILQGTNKAALTIWRRDKEVTGELVLHAPTVSSRRPSRASFSSHGVKSPPIASVELASSALSDASGSDLHLNSSAKLSPQIPQAAPADVQPKDYIYEQYGIKEDHIFDTLNEQKSSWKQSTLERLLERELAG